MSEDSTAAGIPNEPQPDPSTQSETASEATGQVLDAEGQDALADIPKPVLKSAEMFMAQMVRSGSMPSPFLEKVTPEHVTQVIESNDMETKLTIEDRQKCRYFNVVYIILGLVALGFLVLTLQGSNPDLLEKLITIVLSFVGGMGAGWGLARRRSQDE